VLAGCCEAHSAARRANLRRADLEARSKFLAMLEDETGSSPDHFFPLGESP
jgi:hypothetical protein